MFFEELTLWVRIQSEYYKIINLKEYKYNTSKNWRNNEIVIQSHKLIIYTPLVRIQWVGFQGNFALKHLIQSVLSNPNTFLARTTLCASRRISFEIVYEMKRA
jgi:hypothetical protein